MADVIELPGGPMAPATARHVVSDRLRDVFPPAELADVELMVSELVTNGFIHGGAGTDSSLLVDIDVDEERLRVTVTDPGTFGGTTPRVMGPDPSRFGGLGLFIVEQLAHSWGVERDDDETSVWFEVERPLEG